MREIILFISLMNAALVMADPVYSIGAGLESRMDAEVNPDNTAVTNLPQIYGEVIFTRWVAELEVEQQSRTSSAGSLSVEEQTTLTSAWGRYLFRPPQGWSPFVSAGLGVEFDHVSTRFQSTSDSRAAQRGMIGVGMGLSKTLWKALVIEGEVRLLSLSNDEEPRVSGVLRLGVATY